MREHKNRGHLMARPGLHYFRSSLIPGRFSAAGARRRDARASQYWMMDHFGIHFHFHPGRAASADNIMGPALPTKGHCRPGQRIDHVGHPKRRYAGKLLISIIVRFFPTTTGHSRSCSCTTSVLASVEASGRHTIVQLRRRGWPRVF